MSSQSGENTAAALRAAAVTYLPLPEPPAAYADYVVPDGVTARFFEITSLDRRTGIAVLLSPAAQSSARR